MVATVNANTTTGVVVTSDTSGALALQTGGTTALTISSAQVVSLTSGLAVTGTVSATGVITQTGSSGTVAFNQNQSISGAIVNKKTATSANSLGAYDEFATKDNTGTTNTWASGVNVNTANSSWELYNGGTRFLVTQTGTVLVGTTSAIDGETRLGAINSTSGSAIAKFRNSHNTSGDECLGLTVGPNAQNTSSYLLTGGVYGVANVFFIYGNGNIVNTNNSYGSLSDVKLKENIVDATPKLADLMQVKVRNYNLKSDPNHKQIGVIAQELETVFPAMIDESTDKDAEGNVLETTTKSVKYSVFVPMLIKSIQELSTQVTELKAEVQALKGA